MKKDALLLASGLGNSTHPPTRGLDTRVLPDARRGVSTVALFAVGKPEKPSKRPATEERALSRGAPLPGSAP